MIIFVDGKLTDEPCPKSPSGTCPECPGTTLEQEYGFCKYGLGTFDRCMNCFAVYNFEEDLG
jgi:hypothetical protein